jgi:hypothetical protein
MEVVCAESIPAVNRIIDVDSRVLTFRVCPEADVGLIQSDDQLKDQGLVENSPQDVLFFDDTPEAVHC